jgi:hypothetical protein
MLQNTPPIALLGASLAAIVLGHADPAGAAGQRSFVSTSGIDNPACSLIAPCRSFGAAITATNAGGEIIVLDSGGYGPVTITHSVSMIAPPGVYAGISVFSDDGIAITPSAASDKVVLEGLTINNQGSLGSGIYFNASATGGGTLEVVRTRISGFSSSIGLRFSGFTSSRLLAKDLRVAGSSVGVVINGFGSLASAALDGVVVSGGDIGLNLSGKASVVVTDCSVSGTTNSGISADTGAGETLLVTLDRCTVSRNGDKGVWAGSSGVGSTFLTIANSTLAQNGGAGLYASAASLTRLSSSKIVQNGIGILDDGGGAQSQGDNFIFGNAVNGLVPTVVGSK